MLFKTSILLLLVFIKLPLSAQDNSVLVKTPPKPGGISEAYFKNFSSNIDKLHQLKSGIFVQENIGTEDGKKEVWYVNDQKDSVLLYVVPVGNKYKDGHWLYYRQFLSNMPDKPIFTGFEYIERISRDSFKGTFYKAPPILWSQLNSFTERVDLSKLEPTGLTMLYLRKDPLHYNAIAYEDLTRQSTLIRIRDGKKMSDSKQRENHFRIRVDFIALQCIFFDEHKKQLYTSDYTIWRRKAATEMPYWVEE